MASSSKTTPPKSLRVLCFGDSLTAGYSCSGFEHYPYADHLKVGLQLTLSSSDITVDVAGQSGDQVQGQYLKRIRAKCAQSAEKPYDWIIIMGGTNDLGWGQQPEQIFEGLQKVWTVALNTGANVLALNIIECAGSPPRVDARRNALNSMIMNHQADRFYAFDLWSAIRFTTLDEAMRETIWDDGLHLTQAGYKMMGDAIAGRMAELLKTESCLKNREASGS